MYRLRRIQYLRHSKHKVVVVDRDKVVERDHHVAVVISMISHPICMMQDENTRKKKSVCGTKEKDAHPKIQWVIDCTDLGDTRKKLVQTLRTHTCMSSQTQHH